MQILPKLCALALVLAALSGCAALPRSGPDTADIFNSASDIAPPEVTAPPLQYALVDLTDEVGRVTQQTDSGSIYRTFGGGKGPVPDLRVSIGDQLQITVFESSAGGLFIPREASVRPGNFVSLPTQTIDRTGTLEVPYAGTIKAAGKTINDLQNEITGRLQSRAIEPQVIVSFVARAADVSVVGEVNAAAKITLNFNGDRILDAISRAGGIRYPGHETYVTLQRRNKKSTVYFNRLVQDPNENIFVAPQDTIYVFRLQRFFTAFGASGQQGRFDFETETLWLSDAVGKAGGLLDNRADPAQVFVYRNEFRNTLERLHISLAAFPPDQQVIPTVYRTNLRNPRSFFFAQRFALRDRDVLYVSNADQVELFKFLNLVNGVSSTISGVATDVLVTRDVGRALQH